MENTIKHKNEVEIRSEKLAAMRLSGVQPYQERYERTHLLADISSLPDGTGGIRIAGRVISIRNFGKLTFMHLFDQNGTVQVSLQKNEIGDAYELFKKYVDTGDYVGVEGETFTSKTGEKTVNARSWLLLSKALRPLPEKFHGLADTEQRLRKRYLDLITSPETMERFKKRSQVIKTIRDFLNGAGFLEVETPVLANKASGAIATPFQTHHNALDIDVFLRIAPETYLKRAIAGGFDRVYEFARCFRNEGMDPSHLPDFTMLEYYSSYWNYEDNMDFTEKLIKNVLLAVNKSLEIEYCGAQISFDGEWPRMTFRDLIEKDCGIDIDKARNRDDILREVEARKIDLESPEGLKNCGLGTIIDLLYKKVSRPLIKEPMFVIKHPVELSPLARRSDHDEKTVDRFQLVVNGWEIVNAYSELIDPIDQAARFDQQLQARESGDTETMEVDRDFLLCMEHGMPPMSGWGMGIDRFVALLTGATSLREAVLFPLMRPE